MKTRQTAAVKAHRAKIKALLARDDAADFYGEITTPRMELVSRHLNLLNRKILTEGPSKIPKHVFDKIERVPDLMAS